jgi:hypothetical protein
MEHVDIFSAVRMKRQMMETWGVTVVRLSCTLGSRYLKSDGEEPALSVRSSPARRACTRFAEAAIAQAFKNLAIELNGPREIRDGQVNVTERSSNHLSLRHAV